MFVFFRPRHSLNSLATVVKEMEEIPAYLPSGAALKDSVQRARDWLQDVEALQVGLQNVQCIGTFVKSKSRISPCRFSVWVGQVTNSLKPYVDAFTYLSSCPGQWAEVFKA